MTAHKCREKLSNLILFRYIRYLHKIRPICLLFICRPKDFFLLDVVGWDQTKDCSGIQCVSLTSWFFSVIAGVVDTGDQFLFSNISANFRKNSKWPQWDTQGPGGKLIHEKSLKSKISCQTPFKVLSVIHLMHGAGVRGHGHLLQMRVSPWLQDGKECHMPR